MARHCAPPAFPAQDSALVAHARARHLAACRAPVLRTRDQPLDRRLVSPFLATLIAIVPWRTRAHGFLLAERGAYLLPPAQAPAGTKPLRHLRRSPRWSAKLLADWRWQQTDGRVQSLRARGEDPCLVGAGSVLEQPEPITNDDRCAVRSSTARRLKRIRPGFFPPPGGRPIWGPGRHWLGLLVRGRTGAPTVAALQWGPKRGERARDQQPQLRQVLTRRVTAWGRAVRQLGDRAFASGPWRCLLLERNIRFVRRWKKRQKRLDRWGAARNAGAITRGQRSWA